MQAYGSPNNANVLTIDIPPCWENTKCPSILIDPRAAHCTASGPRFWARTGCRYNIQHNFAQCETGDCSGAYDCGAQALRVPPLGTAGQLPVTIAEWTFNAQFDAGNFTYPDISAVDGVNLNMNIEPIDANSPFKYAGNAVPNPPWPGPYVADPNWLSQPNNAQPLTFYGADLRSSTICPSNFTQTTGESNGFITGGSESPNNPVACLSNCGKYALNPAPSDYCDPTDQTSKCYRWKVFCCPEGGAYDQLCLNGSMKPDDALCNVTPPLPPPTPTPPAPTSTATLTPYTNGAFHGACWYRGLPTVPQPTYRCSCRAFIKASDCAGTVCTQPFVDFPGAQPPFGKCSDVVGGDASACIGDDIFHSVMPRAYSWPNDPQTYVSDAHVYRIVFAPGGSSVPVTPAGPIPLCGPSSLPNSLPPAYQYSAQVKQCAGDIAKGALFAGAVISPTCKKTADCPIIPGSTPPARYGCNTETGFCATWACSLGDGISAPAGGGIVCSWFPPSPTPTGTPTPTATPTGAPTATATSTGAATPTATATGTGVPTATPTGTGVPTVTPTGTGVPTPTATPTQAATVFSGTTVDLHGGPGDQVTTTFVATNHTLVAESIGEVTIGLSNPKLFSALSLSANGQEGEGNAMPPTTANGFTFTPNISLPSGASLTFTVTATLAQKNAMISPSILAGSIAYADVGRGTTAASGTTSAPWLLLMMIATLATMASALRSRRWMLAGGALVLIVAIGGCGGGSSGGSAPPPSPLSSMSVTDASTLGPTAGLPLQVANVKRD